MNYLFGLFRYIYFLIKSKAFGGEIIVFELAILGELPYILPLIKAISEFKNISVILGCREDLKSIYRELTYFAGDILNKIFLIDERYIYEFPYIDLFITPEQFSLGPAAAYSICIFHGQPSKGMTFNKSVLDNFDMFFLYGPLHLLALEKFLKKNHEILTHIPEISKVGYTIIDDLLNKKYNRKEILENLGLKSGRKTVLYAPAFNEYATLRTIGFDLIECLKSIDEVNIIIKLANDSIRNTENFYATGGVNWMKEFKKLETERFKVANALDINPYLEACDVMVTDVSGVAYDFLLIDKPVVFLNCPDFYLKYVPRYAQNLSFEECLADDTINAGRNYGVIVNNLEELRSAVIRSLNYPQELSELRKKLHQLLLYNPGKATEVAVNKIDELLRLNVITKRPYSKTSVINKFSDKLKSWLILFLNKYGYQLSKTGYGYIDAKSTVSAARAFGLSVCEYLEGKEEDKRKKGRRDKIINKLADFGIFQKCESVCEIGAGTGMYLEKVLELAKPKNYEVYETAHAWVRYLKETYGGSQNYELKLHPADGRTLKYTKSNSCDLVHAHGVFVYIPILQTFDYIKESVRICKPEKYIVFDCYLDKSFDLIVAQKWLDSQWRFPVIIPEILLLEFVKNNSLNLVGSFDMVHGSSFVSYLIFQKQK